MFVNSASGSQSGLSFDVIYREKEMEKEREGMGGRDIITSSSCSIVTISALFRNMNDDSVESMLSSNTDGVGETIS